MTNKGLDINLRLKWILGNSSYYDRPENVADLARDRSQPSSIVS